MKFFKDENNELYAYEDNATPKEGLTSLTDEEYQTLLAEKNKPTIEQITALNQSTIKSLVAEATLEIDILQDAIDADEAEDGDDEKLKNWRKYRVLLRKVDTSKDPMELPAKPE